LFRLARNALGLTVALCLPLLLLAGGAGARPGASTALTEVVVTLPQPSLSEAVLRDRGLTAAATSHRRLDLRAPAAVSYLRTLASAQRTLQSRIAGAIPAASVRWRYSVTLNGLAVVLPKADVARLAAIPGATVWPSVTYHSLGNTGPQLIGAPAVWGATLSTAGQGMKIGVIDDGVDQSHPYFDVSGFSYPAGFPKGNTGFTTPKVIVARAFAPASETWRFADTPFDPLNSDHATHVAGIAAGDHDTSAALNGTRYRVSGVAPMAQIGNYKVLTIPTANFGLDGNSPEIAAGIEAAVKDGMNVINLSLGEPEIQPQRDIVVKAIDDAAAAGVVPVIAAGNEFDEAGRGSVGSPGSAPSAITVAASTESDTGPPDEIASFSSGGPTPVSLEMKPDVTAPGVNVISSLPGATWASWSGTSMASPHVAGAAAVLMERHPTWTVAQIKSALESTGVPVHPPGTSNEVPSTREGGGRIDLARADNPLVFTEPTGLSFGLVKVGSQAIQTLSVADAGGGALPWTVTVQPQASPAGVVLAPATSAVVPGGSVDLTLSVAPTAAEGEADGFVLLTRGTDVRRVPYWFRVEAPKLGGEPFRALSRPGVYTGDTAGKPSLVSSYRYPDDSSGGAMFPTDLGGPEQVFRIVLTRTVANFGVAVLSHRKGVQVSPRLVADGDENRLLGNTGLPVALNPYSNFGRAEPVVGAVLPTPGVYDVVFDTPTGAKPGPFTFRFWMNDTTPPTVRLLARTVSASRPLRLALKDAGAGVDQRSIEVTIDRTLADYHFKNGVLTVASAHLGRGKHRVTVSVADYQETKNMEDVLNGATPNTRSFSTTFVVR
jgi:subtilisin family serine protease